MAPPRRPRLRGYVKTFSPNSGWGFVICKDVARDVFLHHKNFACEVPDVHVNAHDGKKKWEVEFDLDDSDKTKPKCRKVVITYVPPGSSWLRRRAMLEAPERCPEPFGELR